MYTLVDQDDEYYDIQEVSLLIFQRDKYDQFFCRFSPEEKAKRDPLHFMPFGVGPRNCIAKRFALIVVKLTIIHMLQKFKIVQAPETEVSTGSCRKLLLIFILESSHQLLHTQISYHISRDCNLYFCVTS